MSKPIQTQGSLVIKIERNGEPKKHLPYITVKNSEGAHGWIDDRDLKKLMKWCQQCLDARKSD